ncbi:hypothetical protein BDV96DRAFT_577650 [Lophiotrema nucula]|uniref:Uncharacterized protein n=1 Tax=Lophiotrema nucula TaxID=690887 RepID=A0A6A5Z5M0_9PLEO|nr:hypothetical protein BDV96DRAFT_577650 [Lophiotrema nucula]
MRMEPHGGSASLCKSVISIKLGTTSLHAFNDTSSWGFCFFAVKAFSEWSRLAHTGRRKKKSSNTSSTGQHYHSSCLTYVHERHVLSAVSSPRLISPHPVFSSICSRVQSSLSLHLVISCKTCFQPTHRLAAFRAAYYAFRCQHEKSNHRVEIETFIPRDHFPSLPVPFNQASAGMLRRATDLLPSRSCLLLSDRCAVMAG